MKKFHLKVLTALVLLCLVSNVSGQRSIEFGKGVTYMAKDTTLKVKFNMRFQNLLVVDYDQASDDFSTQFLVRRARLKFGGYVLNPNIEFKTEFGLSNRDISIDKEDGNTRDAARIILDAVLKWKFAENWALWVGQTKLPGNRERVISSSNLQFVDRSLVNSRYNIDRDAGLQLHGSLKAGEVLIEPAFSISQGEGRNITSDNAGGFDYTVHLDILPLGKFAGKGDYIGADIEREETPKISFGFTYDYNDRAVRQGGQLGSFVYDSTGVYAENSLATFMADMMFKYQGFSFMAEYATKSADKKIEGLSKKFNTGNGYTASAGYLFINNVELALRYTTIRKDNDFSGLKDEDEITIGLSKYIVGHNLKVQTDFSRITQPNVDDGNYRFRMQMELQF